MSLEILKSSGKRVQCRCTKCRVSNNNVVSMIYNRADIENNKASCRMCKFLSTKDTKSTTLWENCVKKELNSHARYTLGELCSLSTNDSTTESFLRGVKLDTIVEDGRLVGVLVKFKGMSSYGYPTFYAQDFYYALRCVYCNQITFVKSIIDFTCNICSSARLARVQAKQDKIVSKSAKKDFIYAESYTTPKQGTKLEASFNKLRENNKGYKLIDYRRQGGVSYTMFCEKCGDIQTVNRADTKIGACAFCKSKSSHELGYLKRDYIGVTKLGLTCVAQDKENFTCTIRCYSCTKEREVSLYDFLNSRYCCDCEKSSEVFKSIVCNNCCKPVQNITMKDFLMLNNNTICECGYNFKDDLDEEVCRFNYINSLKTKLTMANAVMATNIVLTSQSQEVNPELVTEKERLYCGNSDGKYYKRCYCQKHDMGLILNEDEIATYNHQYCSDSRQGVVADLDLKNINLGG